MTDDLWGDGLDICISACNTKKIVDKVKAPKVQSQSADKQLKSKKVSIEDKIKIITEKVYKILGHQVNRVVTIRTKEQLRDYLRDSINTGVVAIDTETNNSTDPMTCKLMGLCLYSPGLKQAYVPINHTDLLGNKLDNQLTELDCRDVLEQYKFNRTFVLMHNAKFDYQVLKCTCRSEIEANWDTLIAANLIDENEEHGLKELYIKYINPDQEKYSIESLFEGIDYNYFPPELFALYAATDSMMTYELYAYQKAIMETEEYSRIYKLFREVEMPCVVVTAEMELRGVEVDLDYVKRLSEKYHWQLDSVDAEIAAELEKIRPQIDAWRLTVEANEKPEKGGKTKAEQLDDPINLASPTQLAILFYDVLRVESVNNKKPRGTGDDELTAINKKYNIPLCKLIGKRREIMKLLTTYIDNIPGLVAIWDDHRLRTHFNQVGTKTGRFSSGGDIKYKDKEGNKKIISGVNMQNIPSHAKEIRMMFKASEIYNDVELKENFYEVSSISEVLTSSGWKRVKDLQIGDTILGDTTQDIIKNIIKKDNQYLLYI